MLTTISSQSSGLRGQATHINQVQRDIHVSGGQTKVGGGCYQHSRSSSSQLQWSTHSTLITTLNTSILEVTLSTLTLTISYRFNINIKSCNLDQHLHWREYSISLIRLDHWIERRSWYFTVWTMIKRKKVSTESSSGSITTIQGCKEQLLMY